MTDSRHLRESPPRHLNFLTKMTVLFGGAFQTMGWFFFFMGSIFTWIFVGASEVKYCFDQTDDWLNETGVVLSSEPSNFSENETRIYRILTTYEVNGETHLTKNYTTGQRYSGGEKVRVRYDGLHPENAFVNGTKRAPFNSWVAFVLVFPIIGLTFILFSLRKNLRSLKLLVNGTFTRGLLVSKTATSTRVNDRTVYQYEFSFHVGGTEHIATCKTHLAETVEDEEKEIILYDRFRPEFNVVYDAAPMPAITEHGQLAPASGRQLLRLLLPAITIGVFLYLLIYGFPFSWG
ncbi:MAG TPA: DUF3592 domain-containing protein [Bacteroidetes bacterium]|nr:DUF3592 domain-containing protein [Bacteroidota bacterium]